MRDFYLFTNTKITGEKCFELLKQNCPNAKWTENVYLSLTGRHRAYLWFSSDRVDDGLDCDIEENKKHVPLENPYIAHLEAYRSIDLKRMLAVLVQIYPELYVNDDGDWYGTAQEYIDTEFDY